MVGKNNRYNTYLNIGVYFVNLPSDWKLSIIHCQLSIVTGLTGFDSIVLCKYKHVARCVISALI